MAGLSWIVESSGALPCKVLISIQIAVNALQSQLKNKCGPCTSVSTPVCLTVSKKSVLKTHTLWKAVSSSSLPPMNMLSLYPHEVHILEQTKALCIGCLLVQDARHPV